MAKLPDKEPERPINFLIKRKFKDRLAIREAMGIREDALPPGKYLHPKIDGRIVNAILLYRKELLDLQPGEFQERYQAEKTAEAKARAALDDMEERKLFFHQPPADADMEHWSRASYWSIDEAGALSFGKDPEKVSWKQVEPLLKPRVPVAGYPPSAIPPSKFAEQFRLRRDLLQRAKRMGQLFDPTTPGLFLAWAKRMEVNVPEGVIRAVEARGIVVADWKSLYDDAAGKLQIEREAARKNLDDAYGWGAEQVSAAQRLLVEQHA